MSKKRFNRWNIEKKRLHEFGRQTGVKVGGIWWRAVGENIGVEINGKGDVFTRPVLVLKKLSRYGFIGIPLTSQPHEGAWYVKFGFRAKDEYAVLAQIRNYSVQRLYRKMGEVDDTDMAMIREGLREFLLK